VDEFHQKRKSRYLFAAILWINEIGWHIWHIYWDEWTIQTMLPLHLCSVLVWIGALGLVTKKYSIYEFLYFMGIGGALQALLTPDVGIYGFPHYHYFQTFISHGLILTSTIYLTVIEGMRPTWKSIWRVFAGMNVYSLHRSHWPADLPDFVHSLRRARLARKNLDIFYTRNQHSMVF